MIANILSTDPNASLHNYYPTSSQAQPLVTSATSTTSAQYSLLPTDSYDGGGICTCSILKTNEL